jgi:hypothetical protein
MLRRTHLLQTTPRPTGNTIAGAEAQLRDEYGPSVHNALDWHEPQGADGFFPIDWVNFDEAPNPAGNFNATATAPQDVPDDYIPGTPVSPLPDWVATECFACLDLQPGFYTMVVNSDDGFQVTMGNRANPKYLALGEFDDGRGSADTLFYFGVDTAGVYLFRLLWFEGTGGANVEWFTVNADGSRALVNGRQTGSIAAYRTRTVAEPDLPPMAAEFNPPTMANGQITLSWDGGGTLEESTDWVTWTTSANQGNPQTVTPSGMMKVYRIRVSP